MGIKRKRLTAAKLLTSLYNNPKWMRQHELRQLEVAARETVSVAEQKALLLDLAGAGLGVRSVWDLVNCAAPYPAAIPILLEHVTRPYSAGVKEGIVRALTTDFAAGKGSCKILINEYKKLNDSSPNSLKWIFGNAISIVSVPECATEIIKLLREKANGRARDMMTLRLARICSRHRAMEILNELSDDPEIGTFAAQALQTL